MSLASARRPQSLSYTAIYEMLSGETDREPGDFGLDGFNFLKVQGVANKRMPSKGHVDANLVRPAGGYPDLH